MTVHIKSSQKIDFKNHVSAGQCGDNNPGIYLDNTYGDYEAKLIVDLKVCHPNWNQLNEIGTKMEFFNEPIEITWWQKVGDGDSNTFEKVTISPQCMFANDYVIEKLFTQEQASTVAVIGSSVIDIEENLNFDLKTFTDGTFTQESASKTFSPFETVHLEIAPVTGFDSSEMLLVPTACYALQDTGAQYKVFDAVENIHNPNAVCDYKKRFKKAYGRWQFSVDMPKVLGFDYNGLGRFARAEHYKFECSIKVCPNFVIGGVGNVCHDLIKDCHYED